MKNKAFSKISLAIMTLILAAAPVFALGNNEAVITETHRAYEQIGDELGEGIRVKEGETVTILEEIDGYYKVQLEDEYTVYIESQYIEQIETEETAQAEEVVEESVEEVAPKQEVTAPKKSKGEEVVSYAKEHIGTPYVYAGNSLTNGVDCSGFTSQVYKKFGVSLQRRSGDQFSSNGKKVSKGELEQGDLVFYGYNGSVTHVGIYAGNNEVVHASTTRGVVVDSLDLRGMPPIMGYKRIV